MVKSYLRGHVTYCDNGVWRYLDNNEIDNGKRPCKRCGKMPTKEGHDACLGHVDGAKSACCGHGIQKPYTVY